MQIAKSFGAEVTGVCSTRNMELVRSLGADHVIDYSQQAYTRNGRRYDLILDIAGNRSISDRKRALTPGGTLVLVGGSKPVTSLLKVLVAARFSSQKLVGMLAKCSSEDLTFLRELIEAGRMSPLIEATYPLHDVPQALRHVG